MASIDSNEPPNKPGDVEINAGSLAAFLKKRFPDSLEPRADSELSLLVDQLIRAGHNTLAKLDGLLNRTRKAREYLANELSARLAAYVRNPDIGPAKDSPGSACAELRRALRLVEGTSGREFISSLFRDAYSEAFKLVEGPRG